MDKIKILWEEFQQIKFSYEGDNTDWKSKHIELEVLESNICKLSFNSTKNSNYNNWIKRQLLMDVRTEVDRVWRLVSQENKCIE